MLFNSYHFLLFFPVITLIYFLIPPKIRWIWLLITSYYFYMCWNPKYVILLTTSIVITYLSGLFISQAENIEAAEKSASFKKLWVALSFILNLSILFFFKYFTFVLSNINKIQLLLSLQKTTASFDLLLPVGISFYTFQALSYTMDVYRGDVKAEKNIFRYALFVSFFPQLVAGPIERSKNLLQQINENHSFDYDNMKNGLLLMLWGYFQKIIIADRAAILVNQVFDNYQSYAGFEIAIAAALFAVQIYCDFSGYSIIAKGAAQVLGFHLMDNFRQPYFATSIQDFWRRWHISLSTWFRDYLYIPLGGSRCSRSKKYRNILITFLLSGLWHGANWNYVFWGGLHGGFQIIGDFIKPYKKSLYQSIHIKDNNFSFKLGQTICTFILVDITWIFFRAPSLKTALSIINQLFSQFNIWIFFDGSLFELGPDTIDFMIMLVSIMILFIASYLQTKMSVREFLAEQGIIFRWSFYYIAIFTLLVFGIYGPGYDANQFFYFQF